MQLLVIIVSMSLLLSAGLGSPFYRRRRFSDDNLTQEEFDDEDRYPYSFAWTASRYYNGAPDREHKEERGLDGITRGVYRYIDPRHQLQEVVYTSDASGFHVDASNLPQDTPAVAAARQQHLLLFDKIHREHQRIGEERLRQQRAVHYY